MKNSNTEIFRFSFIEAFDLLKKNLSIYFFSLSLVISVGLLQLVQRPNFETTSVSYAIFVLVSVLAMLVGLFLIALISLGWFGASVALLRDSYNTGKAMWTKLKQYLWTYIKRLFPLVILMGIVFVIQLGILMKLDSRILLFLSDILSLTFMGPLYALIVIKDLSPFRGVSQTFNLLRKDVRFFLVLFFLYSANYFIVKALGSVLDTFFNAELFFSRLLLTRVPDLDSLLLSPVGVLFGTYITAFTVVYLIKTTRTEQNTKIASN